MRERISPPAPHVKLQTSQNDRRREPLGCRSCYPQSRGDKSDYASVALRRRDWRPSFPTRRQLLTFQNDLFRGNIARTSSHSGCAGPGTAAGQIDASFSDSAARRLNSASRSGANNSQTRLSREFPGQTHVNRCKPLDISESIFNPMRSCAFGERTRPRVQRVAPSRLASLAYGYLHASALREVRPGIDYLCQIM
jgi:hypothetical protein